MLGRFGYDAGGSAIEWQAPFHLVNTYGLFAAMTTERPEIVIEGTADGHTWLPYEFRYKPGDLGRAPPFVAPYQPRLDWQMWFAALYPGFVPARDMHGGRMMWFGEFLSSIMEGRKEVLALIEPLPIPPEKIRGVRAEF